ncbi:hypothetical protein TNCV_1185201 [Trichonephila clavipes]|nr:hypothetical protein TNCV_1185201 [Trichonephila clavipes]
MSYFAEKVARSVKERIIVGKKTFFNIQNSSKIRIGDVVSSIIMGVLPGGGGGGDKVLPGGGDKVLPGGGDKAVGVITGNGVDRVDTEDSA